MQHDSKTIKITDGAESAFEPTWSPDGTKILYWSYSRAGTALKVFNLKSKENHVLTYFVAPDPSYYKSRLVTGLLPRVCPQWAPDMSEVYYSSQPSYWSSVLKIKFSNNKVTQLNDSNIPPGFYCPKVLRKLL